MNNSYNLGKAKPNNEKPKKHTPSSIQADTLFTFMTDLAFLETAIETKMLSPRYCEEDIKYLKIKNIKKIAFPMKCFCDINMHRLADHLSFYGYYGLAFSKEWGMNEGIQPVQYINQKSKLRLDFSTAFNAAITNLDKKDTSVQKKLKNYLLHELMFYKPYDGSAYNRNTNRKIKKCFTDECEWRFIPNVTEKGFQQLLYDEKMLNAGVLTELSNAMSGIPEISLNFNFSDLKYIIVKSKDDFEHFSKFISELSIEKNDELDLISKIIIWDDSEGDF